MILSDYEYSRIPKKKKFQQTKKAKNVVREFKANALGEDAMTLGEAIQRYQLTGKPVPAHLADQVEFVPGDEKPRIDSIPLYEQINRPWYRKGPMAHTGNDNPCHSQQPPEPGSGRR